MGRDSLVRALVDMSFLLADLNRDRIQHECGGRWFQQSFERGWASFATTRTACVRILSRPSYSCSEEY